MTTATGSMAVAGGAIIAVAGSMRERGARATPRALAARDDRTTGFTLLELLVVLVVLGFLMVGLAEGLHLGVQFWDRQRQAMDAVSELDATDRALRRLIEQMDPGGRIEMSDIDGTARTLRFTTQLPDAAGALPNSAR